MDDKSAFPQADVAEYLHPDDGAGLTRRELFAAMAMQGELSAQGDPDMTGVWDHEGKVVQILARRCVSFADALIAELEKSSD